MVNKISKAGQGCQIKDGTMIKYNNSIDYDLSNKSIISLGACILCEMINGLTHNSNDMETTKMT